MNISAKVLDNKTKKPISNVNVRLNGEVVAKTNTEGKFTFTVKSISPNDVIELTYVGYDLFFAAANDFPNTVYLDNRGYALNEVKVTTKWIKTNWFLWLALGVGATAIFAYKKSQDDKKNIVKAKI